MKAYHRREETSGTDKRDEPTCALESPVDDDWLLLYPNSGNGCGKKSLAKLEADVL